MIVYQFFISLKNGESIIVRASQTLSYKKYLCFGINHEDRFFLTLFIRRKDVKSIKLDGEYLFEDFPVFYDPYWFEAISFSGTKIWYYHELDHVHKGRMIVAFNAGVQNGYLVTNDHFEHDISLYHRVDIKRGKKVINEIMRSKSVEVKNDTSKKCF